MGSAIDKAKLFNAKSIPVSINFISQSPHDKAKANYITTTYLQLVREISRLGINASVHLRLDQLGSTISSEEAIENLSNVLAVSTKNNVFVWCELSDPSKEFEMVSQIKETDQLGLSFTNIEDGMLYSKKSKKFGSIKVSCRGKHDGEKEAKSDPMDSIEQIAGNSKSLVLLEPKESSVSKLMKKGGKYRKSLIFEFQLGYAENRLGKLLKKGTPVSVYIPFGKDWASYAMNNVPHKYMRVIASNLLSEGKEEKSE